ncbi:hypothetical protein [Streptomyces sp. BP-8]|uniref:Uncharacterized protein n=1 Tax=Streptomyces sirii TaxID=3127701 RepID=A0ABZ2QRL2_9ACTN
MSAHQHDARETPTMNELLAACAAASAVSTPPDAPEEATAPRQGKPADEPTEGEETPASTRGRDAA